MGCIEIANPNLWVGRQGDERRLWINDAVVGLGVLGEDTDVDPPPLRSNFDVDSNVREVEGRSDTAIV